MTDYRVVRSRRRTVALQVDQTGSVVVRAPMTLPAEEIRTFVEKHETWIHRQQQRQARYRAEHPEPTPQEQETLRRQAKAHLPQRVAYWAGVMGRPAHRDQDHLRPDTVRQLLREKQSLLLPVPDGLSPGGHRVCGGA